MKNDQNLLTSKQQNAPKNLFSNEILESNTKNDFYKKNLTSEDERIEDGLHTKRINSITASDKNIAVAFRTNDVFSSN